MKKHFLLTALLLPLLSALPALASVNPAVVSADAKWLVYADLNALRASPIGQELIAMAEKAQLDTGSGKVGIDWQKLSATVGSATAYGANISPDPKQIDGTLVVQGTADLRKIAESILIQLNLAQPEEVAEITDLPFPAYAIRAVKHQPKPPSEKPNDAKDADELVKGKVDGNKSVNSTSLDLFIAFPPEAVVLVSKSRPQILKAREVLRGIAPSLTKTPDSPLAKFVQASDGAYLIAASIVPTEKFFSADATQARILKMTSAGSLAFGERGDTTFAHSELVASSDQMAEKLMKILQGMTAMMSLAETNDKQLAEFLNSAAVNRNGDTVTLDLAYSSTRLAAMIKTLQQPQQSRSPDRAVARTTQMINGKSLAEWQAESGPANADGTPGPIVVKTIENIALKNGTLLTLARQSNGGRNIRYDHIEIAPADHSGMSLTFRPEFMRAAGPRWQQFQFPGTDGIYILKVAYLNDPEGKATFAVSAKDPRVEAPASAPVAPSSGPLISEPKNK